MLVLNYETRAKDYWAQMGVTCEKEQKTISICRGQKDVNVDYCRGTCKSISKSTMSSSYKLYCMCCRATGFTEKSVYCKDGSVEKIGDAKSCSCSTCLGA